MSEININICELIKFFDEDKNARPHSSAIKALAGEELGFALLLNYLKRENYTARLLNQPCTTGHRQGNQLDGWVEVQANSNSPNIFYQVEVKSWSFHGVGPGTLPMPLECTARQLKAYKKKIWRAYWANGAFTQESLNKVLTPMAPPVDKAVTLPLACVWAALHPKGESLEFFEQKLDGHDVFDKVAIFSMSSFLRNLVKKRDLNLSLEMPFTSERIAYLSRLFPQQRPTSQ